MTREPSTDARHFKLGLLLSIILHAVMVFSLIAFARLPPPIDLNKNTVKVSLVKLSKAHDQTLLPKKTQETATDLATEHRPERERIQEKKPLHIEATKHVKIEKKPEKPKKEPKVAKAPESKAKHAPKLSDRLSQLTKNWRDEGREDGHRLGRELQGSLQADYEQQVQALIQDSYELPAILSLDEQRRLRLLVRIYIGAAGQILQVKIEQASGKSIYDNTVVAGAKKLSNVTQPPLNLRRKYAQEGMLLEFCPISCS